MQATTKHQTVSVVLNSSAERSADNVAYLSAPGDTANLEARRNGAAGDQDSSGVRVSGILLHHSRNLLIFK